MPAAGETLADSEAELGGSDARYSCSAQSLPDLGDDDFELGVALKQTQILVLQECPLRSTSFQRLAKVGQRHVPLATSGGETTQRVVRAADERVMLTHRPDPRVEDFVQNKLGVLVSSLAVIQVSQVFCEVQRREVFVPKDIAAAVDGFAQERLGPLKRSARKRI